MRVNYLLTSSIRGARFRRALLVSREERDRAGHGDVELSSMDMACRMAVNDLGSQG